VSVYECIYSVMPELIRHPVPLLAGGKNWIPAGVYPMFETGPE
jgi:hypothetical protein